MALGKSSSGGEVSSGPLCGASKRMRNLVARTKPNAHTFPSNPKSRFGPAHQNQRIPRKVLSMSLVVPRTPKATKIVVKATYQGSPPFTGIKFSDPPSARSIPLPPRDWFNKEMCDFRSNSSQSLATSSASENESSSGSSMGQPLNHSFSTRLTVNVSTHKMNLISSTPSHIRLTALQLIAACAAS